jgi:predicted enzyme related to lactoylglutathione lyase
MQMNANLSTLMVYVHDMPRAVAFYRQLLGGAPSVESPGWSQFDLGSGIILGLHHARDGHPTPTSGWTPGFNVTDLPPSRQQALAAGGSIAGEYHDIPGGVVLDVRDPDGNVISLSQMGVTCADLGVKST